MSDFYIMKVKKKTDPQRNYKINYKYLQKKQNVQQITKLKRKKKNLMLNIFKNVIIRNYS